MALLAAFGKIVIIQPILLQTVQKESQMTDVDEVMILVSSLFEIALHVFSKVGKYTHPTVLIGINVNRKAISCMMMFSRLNRLH